MRRSLLVLDDIDLILAESPALLAYLRAQLRMPLPPAAGGQGDAPSTLLVLGTASVMPSSPLAATFDETLAVPLLQSAEEAHDALEAAALLPSTFQAADGRADSTSSLEGAGLQLSFPLGVKQLMREAQWLKADGKV